MGLNCKHKRNPVPDYGSAGPVAFQKRGAPQVKKRPQHLLNHKVCGQAQGRRQRGASGAGPPFEIGAPPFNVWLPSCCIHPILYFLNVAPPPSGFWPLF